MTVQRKIIAGNPSSHSESGLPLGRSPLLRAIVVGMLYCTALPAMAQVSVCVSVSSTGPAAALGIPEANTVQLLPAIIAGQVVDYSIFDDATDPNVAVRNARRCVEDVRADVIIGSSTTPTSAAIAGVASQAGVPVITLAPLQLDGVAGHWSFPAPQPNVLMAEALVQHMKRSGIKTVGFLGFADAYGDDWLRAIEQASKGSGVEIVANERFGRTDVSVTGQALKLVSLQPDAVFVAASGTPAALPNLALEERGFAGLIYQTHGAASQDFLRLAGPTANGTILPMGPLTVAEQLPTHHPSREPALAYRDAYEAAFGAGTVSSFGGHMMDAGAMIAAAVPEALGTGHEPGTPEFAAALREALASLDGVVGVHGVFTTSEERHQGHDARSRVLVEVVNGEWDYLEDHP